MIAYALPWIACLNVWRRSRVAKLTPAPLIEISHLLIAGKLEGFRKRWGGSSDCHAIAQDLLMDLFEANSPNIWCWCVGRQPICGDHSWIESGGFAVDPSNGASRSMLIAPITLYRAALAASDIAVFAKLEGGETRPVKVSDRYHTCGAPIGAGMLAVYSLGLGIPFIVAAFAIEPFAAFLTRFRAHLGLVEKAMGGLLVLTGVAFLTGAVSQASFWLLETFPMLGKIG